MRAKTMFILMIVLMFTAMSPLYASASSATTTSTTAATTTTATTTTVSSTKTTKTTTTTTAYVISTSPSTSLGSITFKTSNSKRVEVGKSTYLYITIKDMSGSVTTTFSCSNTTIASIEKVNNTCVKVYGLKNGEVIITATAGGKSAKYDLIVGDASATSTTVDPVLGDVTTTTADVNIDIYATTNSALEAYLEEKERTDAVTIIIGIVGWTAIIIAFSVVLSVMFRNRTPKLNLYPGSRRRFNTGGYRGNQRKRLLPDHYYRSIRKY